MTAQGIGGEKKRRLRVIPFNGKGQGLIHTASGDPVALRSFLGGDACLPEQRCGHIHIGGGFQRGGQLQP